MGRAKLYIKTGKVPVVAYEVHDIPGHYCQDGYRTQSTMTRLSPEDAKAKDILTRLGVKFELVDLSEGRGGKKAIAWIRGVRKTPTLRVGGGRHRKYEGVVSISEYATASHS